jgi:phage-related protein
LTFRILFYRTRRGEAPFETFLEGHNDRVRAKFFKLLTVLEECGPDLKRPYADVLRGGVRELRVGFGGNAYRALYFFFIRDRIVVTHAFMKKTEAAPPDEIERALRFKRDFEERFAMGEFDL